MGAGMICPVDKVDHVISEMDRIYKEAVQQDLNDNGKASIIRRELNNFECDYSGDCSDVIEALAGYGITADEILTVFNGSTHSSSH